MQTPTVFRTLYKQIYCMKLVVLGGVCSMNIPWPTCERKTHNTGAIRINPACFCFGEAPVFLTNHKTTKKALRQTRKKITISPCYLYHRWTTALQEETWSVPPILKSRVKSKGTPRPHAWRENPRRTAENELKRRHETRSALESLSWLHGRRHQTNAARRVARFGRN